MIEGLNADPDLRDRQMQFIIARLAFRQHILENAMRAIYLFEAPKTEEERANAQLAVETALAESDDPGRVIAFAKDHPEMLPVSMR